MEKSRRLILLFGILTFLVITVVSAIYSVSKRQSYEAHSYDPYRAKLEGDYLCLPTIDSTDAKTCKPGILTDEADYYAIDFYLMSQEGKEITVGDRIIANGLVTPIQRLSTNQWNSYPIKAIFSVTDSLEIIE